MVKISEDYRVYYRTEYSQGSVTVKACGTKEAMQTLEKRMPLANVTRAEKV